MNILEQQQKTIIGVHSAAGRQKSSSLFFAPVNNTNNYLTIDIAHYSEAGENIKLNFKKATKIIILLSVRVDQARPLILHDFRILLC